MTSNEQAVANVAVDDGCRLRVVRAGRGPVPVVLLHGGPGWPDYLDGLAGLFGGGVTTYRFDQRACGRSDAARPWTLQRYLDDLRELRQALGVEAWHVVGHSWGATFGLLGALDEPEAVLSLGYLSGTGLDWARWVGRYREELHRRLTTGERERLAALQATRDRTEEQEAEMIRLMLLADAGDRVRVEAAATDLARRMAAIGVNHELNHELNREVEALDPDDLASRCASLDVPVLIGHGARDPRPVDAVATLVEALPDVTCEVLPGVGHDLMTEAPTELVALLQTHVQSP